MTRTVLVSIHDFVYYTMFMIHALNNSDTSKYYTKSTEDSSDINLILSRA